MEIKNALVVEGGAMRGIFSTGILDAFIKEQYNPFDICIGISAGSTNLASYLAQMYQRNYVVYTKYSIQPEFISWKKFFKGGHLVDLDWLWDITIREIRLDLDKIVNSRSKYYVGLTEAKTGKAVFVTPSKENLEEVIKASSAIPIFYRGPVVIDGVEYVDGGLADPIPVLEAYKRGAKNIMVIRSRPYTYTMKPSKTQVFSKPFLKKYPALLEPIKQRAKTYQEAIDFMRNPPKGINIIEVNPPESFKTGRLTKDLNTLEQDYQTAYKQGLKLVGII